MALAGVVQECDLGVACPRRETAPYGVVSLFVMLDFCACIFWSLGTQLRMLHMAFAVKEDRKELDTEDCARVRSEVEAAERQCVAHNLSNSAMQCQRILQFLEKHNQTPVTYQHARTLLGDLTLRVEDDLHANHFLHLSLQEADLYIHSTRQWESVIERFHKTKNDIEESSKCFALCRYAASLFHVLLVAELGIIEVARLFDVEGDKPGWGALERLKQINDKKWADKSPLEQKHSEFLKNLLPLAFAIKDSWRHKLNHIDNKLVWMDTDFSPQVATEIISATRGFMRKLANDLPSTP